MSERGRSPGARARLVLQLVPVLAVLALFAAGLGSAVLQSLGVVGPGAAGHLTLEPYSSVLGDEEFRASLALTLWVATASTVVATVGGVGLALLLMRLVRGRGTAHALLQVPLAVPHLAIALSLITLAAPSGWLARVAFALGLVGQPADVPAVIGDPYGAGIILAYVAKEIPFIAIVATALLVRTGRDFDEVARTLGASPWQRLRHITLPLLAPGVTAAALIVFAYVFAAFETPFLLGRPYPAMLSVVAERRYMSLELADRPSAVAFAVVMTLVAALAVRGYMALSSSLLGRSRPVLY
jgi:putative spermidine/putrescine transport system permease protein